MPVVIAAGMPRPLTNTPSDTATILPPTTTASTTTISIQCAAIAAGSISMPTDTKKIAANRSRIGSISGAIAWSASASATSAPARNAPSATE